MSHTHIQCSFEDAFKQQSTPDVNTECASLTKWVWELLSIKNEGIESKQWSLFHGVYFMEFFVESTCKELRTQFHNRNGPSISHSQLRSANAFKQHGTLEHLLFINQICDRSHNMCLGTCLNKNWHNELESIKYSTQSIWQRFSCKSTCKKDWGAFS